MDKKRFIIGSGLEENSIKDNLTGLMWIKDLNTINNGNGKSINWENSFDLVKQANDLGGYCGYTDWRLPILSELISLVNFDEVNIYMYLNKNGFKNVRSHGYWSSTSYAPVTNNAWNVNFDHGVVDACSKNDDNYLFLVRELRNK
jgi:hypothetical protein